MENAFKASEISMGITDVNSSGWVNVVGGAGRQGEGTENTPQDVLRCQRGKILSDWVTTFGIFCMEVKIVLSPSIHLPIHVSVRLPVCSSIHPPIHPSIRPSTPLSIYPLIRPSVCSSVYPSNHLSIHLSISISVNFEDLQWSLVRTCQIS